MKTKKLTKNSYKRKIILFAVFVFVSISLISTGFAAWVLSSNSHDDATGNVEVGVVKDGSLKVEIVNKTEVSSFTFKFEPVEGDKTGRVRVDKNDKTAVEALSLTIQGKINKKDILGELNYEIELPAGLIAAANADLIVLPEGVKNVDGKKVIDESSIQEDGTFSFTIKFNWGSVFEGENPSTFYDRADKAGISDEEVQTMLEDIRAYVYGYYSTDAGNPYVTDRAGTIESHKDDPMPTFKVTITAIAN